MKKCVIASGNKGKIREFAQLFSARNISLIPQTDLDIKDIPETGTTFVENAIIKARNATKHSGLPALADDSGLVVDALGGAPGIYSSRYAGENATDTDNINKLLQTLGDNPNRKAHFQCVLVFMRHHEDPVPLIAQGQWHGEIAHSPMGKEGFGYDPIFFVPSLGVSAAELEKHQKNAISHRSMALRTLCSAMDDLFA